RARRHGAAGMTESRQAAAQSALQALRTHGIAEIRLVNDSRRVRPGDVFVAYPGERRDGRAFVEPAIAAGAGAVLWEQAGFDWPDHWQVPNLAIAGLRELAGELAALAA